jgi:hypothetical protein
LIVTIKMTDRQRQLMAEALQHKDRLLTIPQDLNGAAVARVSAALIAGGMAEEVKAKAGAPVWRSEVGGDQCYSLRQTARGVKAIAANSKGPSFAEDASGPNLHETPQRPPSSATCVETAAGSVAATPSQPCCEEVTLALRAPRSGSKLDGIIGLLSSREGATLDDLTRATNWLPHTARAALTGLQQ